MSISLEKALEFATNAHKNQKRWDGSPYINHPIRVAESLEGTTNKIVALNHDVKEDCGITDEYLLDAGFSPMIVDMIDCLTKRKGENYLDYLGRVCKYDTTIDVKCADLQDNMSDLRPGNMFDKYSLALFLLKNREGIELLTWRSFQKGRNSV